MGHAYRAPAVGARGRYNAVVRYLVQLLVPLYDNSGTAFPRDLFAHTRGELIDKFGGLTAYTRAPARGVWKADDGEVARDDIAIFEVMAEALDRAWWSEYRATLEQRFRQDEMVIRAMEVEQL